MTFSTESSVEEFEQRKVQSRTRCRDGHMTASPARAGLAVGASGGTEPASSSSRRLAREDPEDIDGANLGWDSMNRGSSMVASGHPGIRRVCEL